MHPGQERRAGHPARDVAAVCRRQRRRASQRVPGPSASERGRLREVGGGASAEQVQNAFRILLSDKNVKAVLINIFGGIMRCDVVASGVVEAAKAIGIQVPVVVRLEGTNVEQGQEILRKSGLNFIVAEGMKDAAEKVVAATRAT